MSGWPVYNHIGGKRPMTRQDAIDEAVRRCISKIMWSHRIVKVKLGAYMVPVDFIDDVRAEFRKIIMESDTEKHFFRNMTVAEHVAITGV